MGAAQASDSRDALFRHVSDLFLADGGAAADPAQSALLINVVQQTLREVDKSLRLEAAARLGSVKRPNAAFVQMLLNDEPDVFNTVLRNIRLAASDWRWMFNRFGERARLIAAERADLPADIAALVRPVKPVEEPPLFSAGETAARAGAVLNGDESAEILALPPRGNRSEPRPEPAPRAGAGAKPEVPRHQPAPALIWSFEVDRFGRFTQVSEAAEAAFRAPPSALIGENFVARCSPVSGDGHNPILAALRQGEGFRDVPVTLVGGDGRLWLISAAARFAIGDGAFEGYRGTALPAIAEGPAMPAPKAADGDVSPRVAQILSLARSMGVEPPVARAEAPAVEEELELGADDILFEPAPVAAPTPVAPVAPVEEAPTRTLDADDFDSIGRNVDHIVDRMFAPSDLLEVVAKRIADGGFPTGMMQAVAQIRARQQRTADAAQDLALAMHLFGAERTTAPRIIRLEDVVQEALDDWADRIETDADGFSVTSGLPELAVRADWKLLKYTLLRMFAAANEDGALEAPYEMGVLVQGRIARLLVPFPAGAAVAESILRPVTVLKAQLEGREPLYLDAAFGLSLAAALLEPMGASLRAIEDPVLGAFLALQIPVADLD